MYGMNILKCFSHPGHSKQFTTTRGTSTMVRYDVGYIGYMGPCEGTIFALKGY